MGRFVNDTVIDQLLDYIKQNADKLVICYREPTSYSDATTDASAGGEALGETAVGATDFTIANGDKDGRKVTVAAQSGITIDDGTQNNYYFALVDDTNSALLLVSPGQDGAIIGVDTANDTITVEGDMTATFNAGDVVAADDRLASIQELTVASVALSGGDTVVTVNEDLTDGTVAGILIKGQAVAQGNVVDTQAFDEEVRDPIAP